MPIQVLMPALSPTMTEGKLAKWSKNEGDAVASGDVLCEIETDKATMEVEAVDEGTLGKILVPAGTEGVAVNAPIALLLEEGEDASALEGAAAAPAPPQQAAQPAEPARRPRLPARPASLQRGRPRRHQPPLSAPQESAFSQARSRAVSPRKPGWSLRRFRAAVRTAGSSRRTSRRRRPHRVRPRLLPRRLRQ
jgi:pyruvate dehydrogenase E2 component (dihydrolipoamide acetyltransferase)